MQKQHRGGFFLALLTLTSLLTGLLAVGASPRGEAAPAAAPALRAPPIRVDCGPPDVPGWVVVTDYLAWSGCVTWECWSSWIYNDPSNALMEKQPRLPFTPHGSSNPGPPWPPYGHIFDGRERCEGDGKLAAGQWYHNANAKPYFRYMSFPGDPPWLECEWRIDPQYKHFWNFGEQDDCPPVCEVDPWTTPPATVCEDKPLYKPTLVPPTPSPVLLLPPDIQPKAYVRSSSVGDGGWYATDPDKGYFYWPWQMYLNISFSGKITEPGSGCASSSTISRYLLKSVGDRGVCAVGDPVPLPGQTSCLDPDGCCGWQEAGDEMHLLFRQNEQPTPVQQGSSWFFWGIYPGPLELRYQIEVVSTYYCEGDPAARQVTWYFEEALTAYLTKSSLGR